MGSFRNKVLGSLLFAITGLIVAKAEDVKPSYSEAIKSADGEFSLKTSDNVQPNYNYQSGSISKFACTLAAFQLQKEGKLSIDSAIGELLPNYNGAGRDTVTLRNILENRSGLVEGIMIKLREDRSLLTANILSEEATNLFAGETLEFSPGEKFDYIITNWVFVQAILEKASGKNLAEVLKHYVFDPAKMAESNLFVGQMPEENTAKTASKGRPLPNFVSCSGGVSTTPRDLIKLVMLPYRDGYLSGDDIEELHKISTPEENYTLGGRIEKLTLNGEEHIVSWQSGTNGDYRSMAVYDPKTNEGFALMTTDHNYDFLDEKRDNWLKSQGYVRQDN